MLYIIYYNVSCAYSKNEHTELFSKIWLDLMLQFYNDNDSDNYEKKQI